LAYDDEEQLEALRHWWARYGRGVVIGLVVALVAVLGYQQWQSWQSRQLAGASADHSAVLAALDQGEVETAANRVAILQQEHGQTTQAALATLAVAGALVETGAAEQAARQLAWVTDAQAGSALADIARLRQGEALAAAGDTTAALDLLQPLPDGQLRGRFLELQGDLQQMAGDARAAAAAYADALEQTTGQRRSLVEIKLNNLGGAPES